MTESTRPPLKERIPYHAALLGIIATLSAVLLVVGDLSTRDEIRARLADDLRASLGQVILPEMHDNNLLDDRLEVAYGGSKVTVYRATKAGKVTALAYQMTGFGYGGAIVLMMAVDPNGQILGVRVLAHSETPGLGDNIEANKDDWINRFDGHSLVNTSLAQWAVKKDGGIFDQFSGATITPRAVVKTVKEGLQFFATHREQLLASGN